MKANRPSATAIKIARGIAFVAEDRRVADILPPGTVELSSALLERAGLMTRRIASLYRKSWFRRFAFWIGRRTAPGQMMTLPVRKRFMDDEVKRAIGNGARQLLVVGAGFDTLALRIAREFPEVQCFELDHPATQRVKRDAAESLELGGANLHWVPADLSSTTLVDALKSSPGWDRAAPTVVTAEGVLMYLDSSDVVTFFKSVRESTGPGTTLVFTHLSVDDDGELETGTHPGLIRTALKLMGEPLRWGIRQEDLPEFLETTGYRLCASPTSGELAARYLEPVGLGDEPVGDIELLASAEVQ